jgi:hypothetical protein
MSLHGIEINNKKIKKDIRKEKIGVNEPNPDPNCGATTAEFMMILGKKVDKALDIHNNINKIINNENNIQNSK